MSGFKRVIKGGDFLKPKKWDEWSIGDSIEGVYENASELDRYGKPIFEIRITKANLTGSNPTITKGEKAGIMPLYPNGGLMMQMKEASYGDTVRITYGGKNKINKGQWAGTMAHAIVVEIDGYVPEGEEEESEDAADSLLG